MLVKALLVLSLAAFAVPAVQAGHIKGGGRVCIELEQIVASLRRRYLTTTTTPDEQEEEHRHLQQTTKLNNRQHRQLQNPTIECPTTGAGNVINPGTLDLPDLLSKGLALKLRFETLCYPLAISVDESNNAVVTFEGDTTCAFINGISLATGILGGTQQLCYNDNEACFTPAPADTANLLGGLRRRNLLEEGVPMQPQDARYQEYLAKCAKYDYDVSLHVEKTHLMAVASPPQDAVEAAGCPLVMSHTTYDPSTGTHVKEVLAFEEEETRKQAAAHFSADSHPVGTFQAADLAKAFESIDIMAVMKQGKAYDVVSNNCASYLMALARQLDVKIDAKMTAFVARRLLETSTQNFVDSIRESKYFKAMFSGRGLREEQQASDEQVIEALVHHTGAALARANQV